MTADEQRFTREASQAVRQCVRRLNIQLQNYLDTAARRMGQHRTDMVAIGVLLDAARRDRALTPGDLARNLNLSAAAVSALLDRLERAGHVDRHPHTSDRRRVVAEPTARAADVSSAIFADLNEAQEAALAKYTDDELDVVRKVLSDLTEATRQVRTTRSTSDGAVPADGGDDPAR